MKYVVKRLIEELWTSRKPLWRLPCLVLMPFCMMFGVCFLLLLIIEEVSYGKADR